MAGEKKAKIESLHAEYSANEADWTLCHDAYHGTGGFADGSYLTAHPLEKEAEGEEDFKQRKELAKYENDAAWIVDSLHSHLFKRPASRSTKNAELSTWLDDCNGVGTRIGEFLKAEQLNAQILGHVMIFMDRPSSEELRAKAAAVGGVTKADEKAAGVAPYVYAVSPRDVLDWATDKQGNLLWVKVRERHLVYGELPLGETDPLEEAVEEQFIRIWTTTETVLYDKDDKEVADSRLEHNLGVVPAIFLYCQRGKGLIGKSRIRDIAHLAVKKYNVQSEKRQLQRDNSFSMLAYPVGENSEIGEEDEETGERKLKVGAGRVLQYDGAAAHSPGFIGADASHVESYANEEATITAAIHRLANMKEKGGVSQSGIAWAFDWELTNNILADMAGELQEADRKLIELWHIWQAGGVEAVNWDAVDYQVQYPESFSYADENDVIDGLVDLQDVKMPPEVYKLYLKVRGFPRLFPNMAEEDRKVKVDAVVDGWDPAATTETPLESNMDETLLQRIREEQNRAAGGGA